MSRFFLHLAWLCAAAPVLWAGTPSELRVGVGEHAFDHLGNLASLSGPAADSGFNIIYCTGLGVFGYTGLPVPERLSAASREQASYLRQARSQGITLALGYVCATSMVKLDSFDKNWTPQFRAQFSTPPAQWRQVNTNGQPLPSWYGAPYEPACMNNPDWRAYEKAMVRLQLEIGCDGIFFDNPTVHPTGCYCRYCMEKYDVFLAHHRDLVRSPKAFLEFRSTIAADFMADIRKYARTIKPSALITCNNSLNSPEVLFSQCRAMGYNIEAMSGAEDFITIEDMGSEARKLADGRIFEYGPTYHQLHAISHGKPIVATTLAEADYHASPGLARLSMAEAAANEASWMLWPAWPANSRAPMAAAIRPESDFLRQHEKILNDTIPRCDVLVYLQFRRWLETDHCTISDLAAALGRGNVQYVVCAEDNFPDKLKSTRVLLIESRSILNPEEKRHIEVFESRGGVVVEADAKEWFGKVRRAVAHPSLVLHGPDTVRAVVRDQQKNTIVHLYNLDVVRLSSFEDQVHPVSPLTVTLRVPSRHVRSVTALTADTGASTGPLAFTAQREGKGSVLEITCPKLELSTILLVQP